MFITANTQKVTVKMRKVCVRLQEGLESHPKNQKAARIIAAAS